MPPTFPSTESSRVGFFTDITFTTAAFRSLCSVMIFPLIARLRSSGVDAYEGTEEILVKLVGAIRARFPDVRIIFRGDSDFCRESILKQCEVMSTVHAAIWRIASKSSSFICLPTALPPVGEFKSAPIVLLDNRLYFLCPSSKDNSAGHR